MERIINLTLIFSVVILIAILTFEFLNYKEGFVSRFPYPLITSICCLYFIKTKRARRIQQDLEQKG
ncbi:hypothetical protein DBR43_15110 [Pedobacter sp. KBW06]|uniref:hypothetical protein n=1 Tax=Pedobacter sp. KBW06 TaxID=2153359 RepID=UPI000F5A86D7|nr:hypothetical protein [Pedobacter sp. KBW06]RQO69412.1 hypothetical protein DBR43_15110 [Pedobacter sp. KBW06]